MLNKSKNIDFTQGSILKNLILFFLPILAGSLFQQFYITTDAIIVGKFAGKEGLAAIEAVGSLLKIPINVFIGISTGATIIISQYFGAKKEEDMKNAIHTSLAFSIVGGVVLSILGMIFAPYFLRLLNIPESIIAMSLGYVQWIFSGFVFSMIFNMGSGILRAIGDSRNPVYVLIMSGMLNVGLDLIFVALFKLNALGAAIATVIAQAFSAVLVLNILIRIEEPNKVNIKHLNFNRNILSSIFKIGVPIALQSAFYPIANVLIQSSLNSTGVDNIAAWSVCGKLSLFVWIIMEAFGMTVSTFVCQNYGAKLYSRIKKGMVYALVLNLFVVGILSVILYFFSGTLSKLFIISTDYGIIPLVDRMTRFLAPFYISFVFTEILSSTIRGTGESFKPMLITLIGTCITRILWIYFAVPKDPKVFTILKAFPISWLVTSLAFVVYYYALKYGKGKETIFS